MKSFFGILESVTPTYITPNRLSWSRIWAVPIIWLMYFVDPLLATVIYALACITDGYDGYLARTRHIFEKNGPALDERSDKILVLGIIGLLFAYGLVPLHVTSPILWCIGIIVGREIVITVLRMALPEKAERIPSLFVAKLKTFFLMPGLGFLMLGTIEHDFFTVVTDIGIVGVAIATVFAVVSAVQYMWRFRTVQA